VKSPQGRESRRRRGSHSPGKGSQEGTCLIVQSIEEGEMLKAPPVGFGDSRKGKVLGAAFVISAQIAGDPNDEPFEERAAPRRGSCKIAETKQPGKAGSKP